MRHLGDVGARGLAERGDGVDGGDALRQEGVGGELGQLGGPQVGGDDAVRRNPLRQRDCTSTGSRPLARPCGRGSGTYSRAHDMFNEMKGQQLL